MSSHGDSVVSGAGSRAVLKSSSAQIIWAQVVPALDGALMTMSPSRKAKPSHRALSSIDEVTRRWHLETVALPPSAVAYVRVVEFLRAHTRHGVAP